jgi:hypothetical protein
MASQWARETHPLPESSRSGQRRARRRVPSRQNDIYNDLLVEVLSHSSQDEHRPLKRRKSQRPPSEVIQIDDASSDDARAALPKEKEVVVIDSSSDFSAGEDDEMEWDTVDLTAVPFSEDVTENEMPAVREITLASTPQKSS